MLFECWVIFLGLRFVAQCLYYFFTHHQHPKTSSLSLSASSSSSTNTNKKNNNKSKRVHKRTSSSADNTESEQEINKVRSPRSGYSTTPIHVTKRYIADTLEDTGIVAKSTPSPSPSSSLTTTLAINAPLINATMNATMNNTTSTTEEMGFGNTGIIPKPAKILDSPELTIHENTDSNNNNNNATHTNTTTTNTSNNGITTVNEVYGSGVANKYGYYGRKSFASAKAASGSSSSNKHKAEFTIGDVSNANRRGETIDWNAQFQGLLQLPEATEQQKQDKYEQLSALSKDFLHVAVTFGRIIISEAYLDPAHRTIIPVTVGGHAGGVKYIYHGVMFKFACDWMNLYGSDAYAMKAGGHELKSLMRYYGREGIHVPLMALIDFRGFRLVAMSILPIKGKDTLVYGSEDGGKSVYASNADFNEKMRDIGTRLNLKGHMAGLGTGQERKFLFAPTDIEGHIGTDGLYYVIDFARTFPPTAGEGVSHEFLYKLFRPEFLQNYPIPLSSDAFSRFGGSGNNLHNQEVTEATEYLLKSVIPRFALWLEQGSNWVSESAEQLTETLHREGINVRYLGVVRKLVQSSEIRQFILVEMVARVVKNAIRQKLRNKMKVLKTLEEGCYIKVVVDFFNVVLGYHPIKSIKFWDAKLPNDLNKQFEGALSEYENFEFSKHKDKIDLYLLFSRVQALSGIKLTAQALADLKNDPKSFKVVLPDIETMEPRVKHMNTVSLAEGNALALQCMRAPGSQRLFRLATDKFERAVRATPDSIDVLNNYGDVLENLAQKSGGKDCHKYLERSLQIYISAQNFSAIVRLAKNLPQIADTHFESKDQLFLLAVKCYEAVLDFENIPDPTLTKFTTMVRFADLLIDLAKMHNSDAHYERAGELIAQADATRPKGHPPLLPLWANSVSNMEKALVWEILVLNTPTRTPTISTPSYLEYDHLSGTAIRRMSTLKANTSALAGAIHAKAFVYKGTANAFTPAPTKGKGIRASNDGEGGIRSIRVSNDGETVKSKSIRVSNDGEGIKGKNIRISNDGEGVKAKGLRLSNEDKNKEEPAIPIVNPNITTVPTRIRSLDLYKKSLLSTWILESIFKHWGPTIENLTLGAAPLDDSVVSSLSSFTRLTYVDLRKNRSVTDSILRKFPTYVLGNVTHLNLSFTNANDLGVTYILRSCTKLQHLELTGCGISEKVLDGNYASNLQHVNVAQTQAHKICSVLSRYCHLLRELIAAHLHITDDDLWELCRSCRRLTKLDVSHSYVSDDGVRQSTHLVPSLAHLDLSSCRYVTAKTVSLLEESIDSGQTLSELILNKCGLVKYAGLNWGFPNLVRLELSQYFLASDGVLFAMSRHCPLLEKIVLSGCHSVCVDGNALIAMTRQCSKLMHLDLGETSASDNLIQKVAPHLVGLTFLSLLKCTVGDAGTVAISQNCTRLLSLNLSGCTTVSDSSIAAITERCKLITELFLGNCVLLTNDAAQHISELHSLTTLDLSSCLLLTDLAPVFHGAPQLRSLTLMGCENVTDTSVALIARLPHLRVLYLSGCKRITDSAISHFAAAAPSLKRLYLGANKTSDSAIAELQQTRMDMEVVYKSTTASVAAHPQNALRSLMRDWKYIQENPLPLISAAPLEHNMYIWHANVLGPENTPYWRGLFHIELQFPTTYPTTSPSATVLTPLPHPHVHANGKICLDMLSDFQGYFQSMDVGVKVKGIGWSSAYSVQTLLLQIQTFLMSVDQDEEAQGNENESLLYLRNIPQAIQQSLQFSCSSCSHSPSNPWPPLDAVLPSKDLPEGEEKPEEPVSQPSEEHLELSRAQRELVCFHTRVNFLEDVLGVGVMVKRLKSGAIDSINATLDLLSRGAFADGVRTSVMGEEFTHWLPLFINEAHGARSIPLAKKAISEICTGRDDRFEPSMAVSVLSKLMNSMVVSLMSEQMHASIKALEGYCAFHRLLLLFVKENPELIVGMNEKIENFVFRHAHRHKRYVAALGEFLPMLTVSKFQWKDVAQAYIEESFDRNVKWLLVKYPELEFLADDPANNTERLSKTFTGNVVSIRLLLFHVHFLQQVARPNQQSDLDAVAAIYDQRFGQPLLHVKQTLQATVKEILRVHTWEEFFMRIGLQVPTPAELIKKLQQALINSAARGYHKPAAEKMVNNKDRKCTSFFRHGHCKYDDACKFSHGEDTRQGRRLSSSDHGQSSHHIHLSASLLHPSGHSLPNLARSNSTASISSDGSSSSNNSDYHYSSNRRSHHTSPPHLSRSAGSSGGDFYRSNSSRQGMRRSGSMNDRKYSKSPTGGHSSNNNNNNNNNNPYKLLKSSNSSSNVNSNNNNNNNNRNRGTQMNNATNHKLASSSPAYTSGNSSSSSSSSHTSTSSTHSNRNNKSTSSNSSQPQQQGYFDKSGLFIPHTSHPLASPIKSSSLSSFTTSSTWKGWSQPDLKLRDIDDANFPSLQTALKSHSATNSDAGSKHTATSDSGLDIASDVSFSSDNRSDAEVSDFNFSDFMTSPSHAHHAAQASAHMNTFANIFNVLSQDDPEEQVVPEPQNEHNNGHHFETQDQWQGEGEESEIGVQQTQNGHSKIDKGKKPATNGNPELIVTQFDEDDVPLDRFSDNDGNDTAGER